MTRRPGVPSYAQPVRRDELYAWITAHPVAVDAVAVAVAVVLVALPSGRTLGAPALLLSLALLLPLVLRRRRPVLVAGLVFTAALLQAAASTVTSTVQFLPADAAVLVALYDVAGRSTRTASRLALGSALLGAVVLATMVVGHDPAVVVAEPRTFLVVVVGAGGLVLAAWTLGDVRRLRLAYVAALEERAERLEREREAQARLATAAERARIAREVHDVVAHSLSVVIAQADGGRYAAVAEPHRAPAVLSTIAETGRTALADMRRLLGVLRDPAALPTAPQPDVSAVPALVEGVRRSGLPVSLVELGAPRELPPALGLAAYRVVQEGLTNVLKHAGPGTPTTVALQWNPGALVVHVDDEGGAVATPSHGEGHGLAGMRERAGMFGGSVEAGPRPGGGHSLRVLLPAP